EDAVHRVAGGRGERGHGVGAEGRVVGDGPVGLERVDQLDEDVDLVDAGGELHRDRVDVGGAVAALDVDLLGWAAPQLDAEDPLLHGRRAGAVEPVEGGAVAVGVDEIDDVGTELGQVTQGVVRRGVDAGAAGVGGRGRLGAGDGLEGGEDVGGELLAV